jgi:hypothetical protein
MQELWVDEIGPPTNCSLEVRNAPQMEQVQAASGAQSLRLTMD